MDMFDQTDSPIPTLFELKMHPGEMSEDHECGELYVPLGHCYGVFIPMTMPEEEEGEQTAAVHVLVSMLGPEAAIQVLEHAIELLKMPDDDADSIE